MNGLRRNGFRGRTHSVQNSTIPPSLRRVNGRRAVVEVRGTWRSRHRSSRTRPAAGPPRGSKRRRSGARPGRGPIRSASASAGVRFARSGGASARGAGTEEPLLARGDVPDQTVRWRGASERRSRPEGRAGGGAARTQGMGSGASCDVGARRQIGRSGRSADGGDDGGPMGTLGPRVSGPPRYPPAGDVNDEQCEAGRGCGGVPRTPGTGAWSPWGDVEGLLLGWLHGEERSPVYLGRDRGRMERPSAGRSADRWWAGSAGPWGAGLGDDHARELSLDCRGTPGLRRGPCRRLVA
jgi:hypothetical protein